jgi:hypothetical protein
MITAFQLEKTSYDQELHHHFSERNYKYAHPSTHNQKKGHNTATFDDRVFYLGIPTDNGIQHIYCKT